MLKYEIFPTKRFPKKTRKRKKETERERERRLIDATVFYVDGKNGTKIDFYDHQASFNQEHKLGLTLNKLSKLFPILAICWRKIKQLLK